MDAVLGPSQDPWLDGFRRRCDPLADAVIEVVDREGGGRALPACERLAAGGEPACVRFLDATSELPDWVDFDEHHAGRRMFERNGLLALLVGFTVLVDSYAGRNDNKVLMLSGRLRGGSAFRRLVETAAFVREVVAEGALRPGGSGHRAVLSVRLLHARVRVCCRAAGYEVDRYDEPINQEALCGTLMLFSSGVILALEKLGVRVTEQERESYHRLWRAAGWLMGVDEALLPETYAGELELYERMKAHQYWPDADTRVLFEAAVEGIAGGARGLPLRLQVLGAGLLRSKGFMREFTRYCVDPRLGEFLVERGDVRMRAVLEAVRAVAAVVSRVQQVPGVDGIAHGVQARMFGGVIEALLGGQRAGFDDPGFREVGTTN